MDQQSAAVSTSQSGQSAPPLSHDVPESPSHSSLSHSSTTDDRIHGMEDVWQAVKLASRKSRRHLFVSWIHVPIGCCFICVACWSLDLLLDLAPFSFPGPVLGTVVFFALLLLLDWLSEKFPGKAPQGEHDVEKAVDDKRRKPKRFVDPVMAVLAPPCDFLLRNMSVLFTPSFILIPARESIPKKEIGLLAAWFAITQVIGYVIPVLIVRGLEWLYGAPRRVKALQEKREKRKLLKRQQQRRASHSHRNSVATLPGIDFEKRIPYGGGERLGSIATGLSGVTAVVVAPVTHVNMDEDMSHDMRRHISGVALEQARQQGEPMPSYAHHTTSHDNISSDVSDFRHNTPHHHRLHHFEHPGDTRRATARRSQSVPGREWSQRPQSGGHGATRRDGSCGRRQRPGSAGRPGSSDSRKSAAGRLGSSRGRRGIKTADDAFAAGALPGSPLRHVESATFASIARPPLMHGETAPPCAQRPAGPSSTDSMFDPAFSFENSVAAGRSGDAAITRGDVSPEVSPTEITVPPRVLFDDNLQTAAQRRREVDLEADSIRLESPAASKPGVAIDSAGLTTAVNSRRPSADDTRKNSIATMVAKDDGDKDTKKDADGSGENDDDDEEEEDNDDDDDASVSSTESYGPDAIERLASWMCDLLTPTIYGILFIVGLPLFFVLDFALPLHMAINILTFWLAITVVPAKLRRYAHPILTTSLSTVLIIWAFGAMRGLSLKEELSYYERRAKFNVLWNPKGYNGPVPGAADILSSLLDAGIVALFVPLYRYRKDLQACGTRLCIALFPCALLSLFVWPTVASLMGLDQIRALAFSARFLSTPLAIQLVNTLGGDESITVILVVLTGIIAAIFKEPFFKLMRVDMDDHLTIGVTFGATSGAIGASSLIARPRVMALASLGFVIFGAMCLVAAAIPPLVDFIRTLAAV